MFQTRWVISLGVLVWVILISTLTSVGVGGEPWHCSSQEDCGDFMICLDNECICDEDDSSSASASDSSGDLRSDDTAHRRRFNGQSPHLPCKGSSLVGDKCDNATFICSGGSVCTTTTTTNNTDAEDENESKNQSVCQCPYGFEVHNHTRECRRSFGFPCDDLRVLCNPEKFISCQYPKPEGQSQGEGHGATSQRQGTCSCHDAESMYFEPLMNSCVSKVGRICELHSWMGIQMRCGVGAECHPGMVTMKNFFGVCKCSRGFYQEGVDKCQPLMGRRCEGNEECDDQDLECVDNKCQCKSGLILVHGENSRSPQCYLKVGEICHALGTGTSHHDHDNSTKCVENASCQSGSDPGTGSDVFACQCEEDFIATPEGMCGLGEGANCTRTIMTDSSHKCHSALGCVNNTCSCAKGFVFNPDTSSCLGTHLKSCSNGSQDQSQCAPNHDCDPFENVCKCRESFHLIPNPGEDGFSCVYGHRTLCEIDPTQEDPCPGDLGLSCLGGRCVCGENGTIFDHRRRRCLLRVGEECSYPHRLCLKAAFCGTGERCQCYSQYTPTPQGTCLLTHGENCDEVNLETDVGCNHHRGLECLGGKCQCGVGQVYNETVETCQKSRNAQPHPRHARLPVAVSVSVSAREASLTLTSMSMSMWGIGGSTEPPQTQPDEGRPSVVLLGVVVLVILTVVIVAVCVVRRSR